MILIKLKCLSAGKNRRFFILSMRVVLTLNVLPLQFPLLNKTLKQKFLKYVSNTV